MPKMWIRDGKIETGKIGAANTFLALTTSPVKEAMMAKRSLPKVCSVPECDSPYYCRGFCTLHYQRFMHSGDPLSRPKNGKNTRASFFERVAVTEDLNACWDWQGSTKSNGYGQISYGGRMWTTHRLAFFFEHGREAVGLVLHACDNRICCNPRHLREGSYTDNTQDALDRGRVKIGEQAPQSRLTEDDARRIKQAIALGESDAVIHRRFAIAKHLVRNIRRGLTWRWLTI